MELAEIKAWLGNGAINIFGRPLSGKDTQGQALAKQLDGAFLSSGRLFRQAIKNSAGTLKDARQALEVGTLPASEDFFKIILPVFSSDQFAGKPLILSSVGRRHGEEETVTKALVASGHPLKAVVYLEASDEDIWHRLAKTSRGRQDDKEHILKVRLEVFKNETLPVVDYYKQKGIVVTVNANQTPEKVEAEILKGLASLAKAN